MAITTYTELKSAITNWTHRAGLSTYADEFIDLVEAKLNRKLRMSEMENTTSLPVTTADLSFPSGFVELREINVTGSPDTTMEYKTPHQFEAMLTTETGKPRVYTIQSDAIKIFPVGTYTISMVYYKSITPLDDTNTTNFVITNFPDLYLHGVLQQAFMFANNVNSAVAHGQIFDSLIEEINRTSRRRKTMGTPLQVSVG